MPSVRVGAIRPMSWGGTAPSRRCSDHLVDLSSRVLGWRRPQPTLHTGPALVRLCQRGAPSLQQTRLNRVRDPARQLRFMLAASGGNHRSKPALVDNDEPMIVEPAPHKAEKALRIVGAR